MLQLNELEQDSLVEIFNIGIGRAAASLSQLTTENVLISVPDVQLIDAREACQHFPGYDKPVCGISQKFFGPFNTEAVLMFPEDKTLEIMQRILNVDCSMEELTELEQEGLCEIGNIVLNACLASIAKIFQGEFQSTLPSLRVGTIRKVLDLESQNADRVFMLVWVNMTLEERSIEGCLAFLSVLPDIKHLISNIDRYIETVHR